MGWILWTIFCVMLINIVFAVINFIVVPVVIFIFGVIMLIFYPLFTMIYDVLKDGLDALKRHRPHCTE
jgi:hypothetical protein